MLEHKYFSHLILPDLETSSASVYQSSPNQGSIKSLPSIGEVSDKVLYLNDTWKPQNCSKIHPPYVCQLKQAVWKRKWLESSEGNRIETVKTSPQEMRTIHNTPANHPQIGLQQCTRCEPNATTFHVFQPTVNNKKIKTYPESVRGFGIDIDGRIHARADLIRKWRFFADHYRLIDRRINNRCSCP